MHRFWVSKPATSYGKGCTDEASQASPVTREQLAAIRGITDVLRSIAMRCVGRDGARKTPSEACPFLLLEMHPDIASVLGLRAQCWVMLELSGDSPTVIFEDRDLCELKRKRVSELGSAVSALHHQLGNPTAFTVLTRQ